MRIFWVLIASLTATGTSFAQTEAPKALTLQTSVQQALESASLVLKRKNDVRSAGAVVVQNHGRYLPTLTATAGYNVYGGETITATSNLFRIGAGTNTLNYAITSNVNLFNGFTDRTAIEAAVSRNNFAGLSLERAKQQVAIDVTQSYLQVILDQKLEMQARATVQTSEDVLKMIEGRKRAGEATQLDMHRQRALVATDRLALIRARERAKSSRLLLAQKLRLDVSAEYTLEEPDLSIPSGNTLPNAEASLKQALGRRKDLQATQALMQALQTEVKRERGALLPKLDLTASLGGIALTTQRHVVNGNNVMNNYSQEPMTDQLLKQVYASAGVLLTWNIFDRRVSQNKIELAQVSVRNAEIDQEDLKTQITVDVKQSLADLAGAVEALESTAVVLESSQKAFQEVRDRYRSGAADFSDLSSVQMGLANAHALRAQAVIGYRMKRDVYAYVTGGTL